MKSFISLCTVLLCVSAIDINTVFEEWKLKYGKSYDTALEHRYRFSVFAENLANIQERNAQGRTIKLGLNKFADLTNDEFVSRNTKRNIPSILKNNVFISSKKQVPNRFDWSYQGQ